MGWGGGLDESVSAMRPGVTDTGVAMMESGVVMVMMDWMRGTGGDSREGRRMRKDDDGTDEGEEGNTSIGDDNWVFDAVDDDEEEEESLGKRAGEGRDRVAADRANGADDDGADDGATEKEDGEGKGEDRGKTGVVKVGVCTAGGGDRESEREFGFSARAGWFGTFWLV